jgi:protein ImuB
VTTGFSASPIKRRILAVWLPRLPTDRLQRRASATRGEKPLVVVAKIDNALRLTAVDRKAAQVNLAAGMTLADARAMIPEFDAVEADEPADRTLLEAIADWCDRYTPLVALDVPHGLLLDVTGATALFGGERALLDGIKSALKRQGFAVQAALAGTSVAARALALYADGAVALPGEEEQAVTPLPVAALNLDGSIQHALKRAGLKTIGDVASRQRAEFAKRFGGAMVATLDCALGRVETPISPRRALPDTIVEHRFADPVTSEAVIRESILALGRTLAGVLESRGEVARTLVASFFRADGQVRRIAVETGKPLRDPVLMEKLFRERLDALADPLDPGFGFDLVRLESLHTERCEAETAALTDTNEDKEIAFLIDRLAARFGAQRVLRFWVQNSHIPEAASAAVPAQYSKPAAIAWEKLRDAKEAPKRPLRLFAKPEPIEVMAEVPDGPPVRFRWRRLSHAVSHAEGPERIAMEWWRDHKPQPTRDYYHVEDQEGRRFWLYRDGLYGRETDRPRWYVHGLFA